MTPILEFNSVTKTYKKRGKHVNALQNVSFQVFEGEVFGFVGPNGAGKSTTIKVMLDIIRDYEGEVRIFGVDARSAESRRGVAFVPESPALYEQFNPLEILKMAMRMYGKKTDDDHAYCMGWLKRFSLEQYADQIGRAHV